MTSSSSPHVIRLSEQLGVDLSSFSETHLASLVQRRLLTLNMVHEEAYLTLLTESPHERIQLKRSLYNHHSVFFRNTLTFAVLEHLVLKNLFKHGEVRPSRHREIRIWSAGCAGGQEAYSLAILLEEYMQRSNAPFSYRILGTDIHHELLTQAKQGYFEEIALRHVPLGRLNRWFRRERGGYLISEDLRKRVDFSHYDLYHDTTSSPPDSIFGGFDLIFCANLLFYYSKTATSKIIQRLRMNLVHGGYLVTGEVERDTIALHRFTEIYPYSSIFQLPGENIKK